MLEELPEPSDSQKIVVVLKSHGSNLLEVSMGSKALGHE